MLASSPNEYLWHRSEIEATTAQGTAQRALPTGIGERKEAADQIRARARVRDWRREFAGCYPG